jgi:hypothetical protein
MKHIKLDYQDLDMFDSRFDEHAYSFYLTHKDAFKQMIKEQVKFISGVEHVVCELELIVLQ